MAPDGAVIKPSAAGPKLLQGTGQVMVFEDYGSMARRIDDEKALRVHGLCLLALLALAGCATRPPDSGLASLRAYRLHTVELPVGDGTVVIAHPPQALPLDEAVLQGWVSDAARAVHTYYGRLPVQRLQVVVDAVEGRGAQSGTAFGFSTPVIRMTLGRATQREDLAHDWMMTHEMVHLAFPRLAEMHHWLEEGLATYVEPIARAQAGQLPAEEVWRDLVHGVPHGLPQPGDRGLDYTPSWGRTYWGGALFCLLAEIEIRKQTDNRYGLQDALRGVVDAGGTIDVMWSIERALETADRAVGADVLSRLYADMRAKPVPVDLADLWRQLGVSLRGDDIVFDDDAPFAAMRKAITTAPPPPSPFGGPGREGGRI